MCTVDFIKKRKCKSCGAGPAARLFVLFRSSGKGPAAANPFSERFFNMFSRSSKPVSGASAWSLVGRGVGALLLVAGILPAMAQTAAQAPAPAAKPASEKVVTVVLTQSKVTKAPDGSEKLVDAPTVEPGDVIEYKAVYTNKTGQAVNGLQADLPIPEGLEYLPRSAKPAGTLVKAAVKGGQYGAEPLMRALPSGKLEPIPYNEYRALRWSLGQLPADGVVAVTARARVETGAPKLPVSASPAAPQAPPAAAKKP